MKKIPYNEFIKSMTMFFMNENIDIDHKFIDLRKEKVNLLKSQMKDINTLQGLEKYIRNNPNSLDDLLVILGVSTEFFKRVISMFRIQRGHVFNTEWSLQKTREFALSDTLFMDKLCNLFLGYSDESINSNIPKYRLRNFVITSKVMNRLQNDDFLDYLIKRDFDTQYNSDVSMINIRNLEEVLSEITRRNGFLLERAPLVDPVGNGTRNIQVNYSITKPGNQLPSFYIKYSFVLTTSRGQSDFKRSVQDLRNYIRNKNEDAKQIVIVDGAGWIGRQSDLKESWDFSDYCLNLKSLNLLEDIITL